jgi:hypothetical protein
VAAFTNRPSLSSKPSSTRAPLKPTFVRSAAPRLVMKPPTKSRAAGPRPTKSTLPTRLPAALNANVCAKSCAKLKNQNGASSVRSAKRKRPSAAKRSAKPARYAARKSAKRKNAGSVREKSVAVNGS